MRIGAKIAVILGVGMAILPLGYQSGWEPRPTLLMAIAAMLIVGGILWRN
jgi:hypothetical protein